MDYPFSLCFQENPQPWLYFYQGAPGHLRVLLDCIKRNNIRDHPWSMDFRPHAPASLYSLGVHRLCVFFILSQISSRYSWEYKSFFTKPSNIITCLFFEYLKRLGSWALVNAIRFYALDCAHTTLSSGCSAKASRQDFARYNFRT